MKRSYLRAATASLFMLSAAPLASAQTEEAAMPVASIEGSWDVALYFNADAPPSSTQMVINATNDGVLTGSFYGSPFADVSRITARGDVIAFSAVTSDASGSYYHSGRLDGDIIEGQTLSEGRGFLMTWTANREPDTSD